MQCSVDLFPAFKTVNIFRLNNGVGDGCHTGINITECTIPASSFFL